MSLAHRTFASLKWTTVSMLVRASLQLGQLVVLARLLSPVDYGLMAIVTLVLTYAATFSDLGLSSAFVQRQEVGLKERSSLYWLSVFVGCIVMLLAMALSPILGFVFNEPRLVPLVLFLAPNLLITSLGQQLRVQAEKNLNFRPLTLIEIISGASSFAIAFFLARNGFGVYSLVFGAMAMAWLNTILLWILLSDGWRPLRRLYWNEARWFLRFGRHVLLTNTITHLNTTVDVLLSARFLDSSSLGLYSVPRNLILQIQFLTNPIFTRVGFPLIARMQSDRQQIKKLYLVTLNLSASLNAPIYIFVSVFAYELTIILLGDSWVDAAPLLRVLAIWGLLRSFFNPLGSLLLGTGKLELSLKWNVSVLLLIPLAIWLGSSWGAVGVAIAVTVVLVFLFVPAWFFLVAPVCGAGFWDYFKQVAVPSACAIFSGSISWFVAGFYVAAVSKVLVGAAIGLCVYLFMSFLFNKKVLELANN